MKQFITIIAILITLASCSSTEPSGERNNGKHKAKLMKCMYIPSIGGYSVYDSTSIIRYVDTLAVRNDIIELPTADGFQHYKITDY